MGLRGASPRGLRSLTTTSAQIQDSVAVRNALDQAGHQDGMLHIPSATRKAVQESLGWDLGRLLASLVPVAQTHAVPPISEFLVGVAGAGASGDLYLGVNIVSWEPNQPNRARRAVPHYPCGSACETRLEHLAVSAAPCGHCRQFMNETTDASQLRISYDDVNCTLGELLPHSFGPTDLGNTRPLFHPQDHDLTTFSLHPVGVTAFSDLLEAAYSACIRSYSPYTSSPSAIALREESGEIYAGFYIENCAFNPSMPPLQAAVINMLGRGGGARLGNITDAVLVECADAPVQQAEGSRTTLASMAPRATFSVVHCELA